MGEASSKPKAFCGKSEGPMEASGGNVAQTKSNYARAPMANETHRN